MVKGLVTVFAAILLVALLAVAAWGAWLVVRRWIK